MLATPEPARTTPPLMPELRDEEVQRGIAQGQPAVLPGVPYPLGADFKGNGTNFSLFSLVAERVELCLFDEHGKETRITLPEVTGYCWHGFIPGIRPGQHYGYRVHGPWDPENGKRCNANKLLLDPYAKAIVGRVQWDEAVFPYRFDEGPLSISESDSAPFMPKCVVHDAQFDWQGDQPIHLPLHEAIIYELHVKGFSQLNPAIPEELRGTYAGLAHPASIDYLKQLGVTAVELMPVHHFIHDKHLVDKGLRNYWGYNSIGFFSPHDEYAAATAPADVAREFKGMVKALHAAGMAVILDVVYNHTAEGNHLGPMLSFKGIDNEYYYRMSPDQRQYYLDFTGTGNSLDMRNPHTLQMLMDSLRYWVLDMHVDGFRFDLASTLARQLYDVDKLSAFFEILQQDPVISQVILIAEPWDVGDGGYQVGNFPPQWSEWNGRYRDCIRNFWKGQERTLGEIASRITGSSDLYEHSTRKPSASINFITAHDGFTLRDLVSYNGKHNDANLDENKDGTDNNCSWNHGAEGATADAGINALRARQQRNMLTMLMLSQGVPMLLHGDECGHSQQGNNNGYCQDNELSWLDWSSMDQDLLHFTRRLIALRRQHPVFRRPGWFQDRNYHGEDVEEIKWFTPEGERMKEEHWGEGNSQVLCIFLNGDTDFHVDPFKQPVRDQSFFYIINSHHEDVVVTIPSIADIAEWHKEFDTATGWTEGEQKLAANSKITVIARSSWLLRH
jgi:isoamylase